MRNFVVLLLLLFSIEPIFSQSLIKQHVQENSIEIHSLNAVEKNDTDLDAIGKAIGEARVVMLGEQDHGDAAAFQLKTRLVRYLHEKKGFDVLAFESDFYGVTRGWDATVAGRLPLYQLINQNVGPVWTRCNECTDLFDYVKSAFLTERPLILAGFDPSTMYCYSRKNIINEIDSFLLALNIPFTSTSAYKASLLPLLQTIVQPPYPANPDSLLYSTAVMQIDTVLIQVKAKRQQNELAIKSLESLQSNLRRMIAKEYFVRMEDRDKQMADNLAWLTEVKYANRKIIVWAASYHIAKLESDKIRHRNMGSRYIAEATREKQSYVMGFTSFGGKTTNWDRTFYEVSSPEKESVEGWLYGKGYEAAFFDLRGFRKRNPKGIEPFFMAGIRHLQQKDDWTKFYDGVIYLKTMRPCTVGK
ncbi:MAG TPA: erythromycin esterase family protein [Flavisolibacter sp.]|nr:erythromycin esterase family protein [Flavisolibacter sp.]